MKFSEKEIQVIRSFNHAVKGSRPDMTDEEWKTLSDKLKSVDEEIDEWLAKRETIGLVPAEKQKS